MRKSIIAGLAVACAATTANAASVYLDGTGLTTGVYTASSPLTIGTALGGVTFVGEINDNCHADGALTFGAPAEGNCFDIVRNQGAVLSFDFEVTSVSFVYGGDAGGFVIRALDALGNIVDSFDRGIVATNGSTGGPMVLSGAGIRSLSWEDVVFDYKLAPIDNILLSTGQLNNTSVVPLPAGAVLLLSALAGGAALRRGRKTA